MELGRGGWGNVPVFVDVRLVVQSIWKGCVYFRVRTRSEERRQKWLDYSRGHLQTLSAPHHTRSLFREQALHHELNHVVWRI